MKALGKRIDQSLPQGHYERASFESHQKMCAIPLLSPPDEIGYQDNNCFQMLIAKYLGQPNPFCQHLAGQFFGRNRLMCMEQIYHPNHYLEKVIQNVTLPTSNPRYDEDWQY